MKLERAKISSAVVEHFHREIFEGRLRPGDKIDVHATADALGVSPTPVREALSLLGRDGVITSQVHRAAFVEHFDARTLRADFHVLGMLSGVAVARVARDRDPSVIAELRRMLDDLRATPADAHARLHDLSTEIRRVEHRAGATPRLKAELRGLGGFLDWRAWESAPPSRDRLVAHHTAVLDAIEAGEERAAADLRRAELNALAEQVIDDLARRGVLPDA